MAGLLILVLSIMSMNCHGHTIDDVGPDYFDNALVLKLVQRIDDLENKVAKQDAINQEQTQLISELREQVLATQVELDNLNRGCENTDKTEQSNPSDRDKNIKSLIKPTLRRQSRTATLSRGVRQSEIVAFTAYLDHTISHLGVDQPIVYDKMLLNAGGAYNNNTGVFTCPFDGIYIFNFVITTANVHQIVAKLVVDGVNKLDGISDTYHQYQEAQGGNYAILSLHKGQTVWVANYRDGEAYIDSSNSYRFASFSGHLFLNSMVK